MRYKMNIRPDSPKNTKKKLKEYVTQTAKYRKVLAEQMEKGELTGPQPPDVKVYRSSRKGETLPSD
jgi:hypothetical protein